MGKRLVVIPWTCHQTGDCCRIPQLVMTVEEARLLQDACSDPKSLSWLPVQYQPKFVALVCGGQCPFLVDNRCSVYDIRPYNCRRFMCLRPDPASEPLESDGRGCANLSDRVQDSREALRFYNLNQRKAQRWGRQHGWSDDAVN